MDGKLRLLLVAALVAAGITAAIALPGWWKALGIAPIVAGLVFAKM
ncbi:MAG: hypothetical protein PHC66_01940 [Candidatus Nanoarchaeia archaeon]|nr:hypothetical protein [Candidatus Nanoarchaeia archaeon]MDD5239049.1 hypothetical protein [Candidatus Nanoarchaeia archaeon]